MRAAQSSTYRAHRLVAHGIARDGEGIGWEVAIRPPGGGDEVALRNAVPQGLDILLEEARARVDRRLDGAAWERQP